jgi:hypothetical protein
MASSVLALRQLKTALVKVALARMLISLGFRNYDALGAQFWVKFSTGRSLHCTS